MNIIYSFTDKHIKQLYQLYKDVGWAKERSIEGTKSCVLGSQVCIGILDEDNNLIGFTRILSDFVYKDIYS